MSAAAEAAAAPTCDEEFSLGRLRGDFVGRSALVHAEVRLLHAVQHQDVRP